MTYSIDLREAVISYIKNGGSRSEAARIFGVSRPTLYRWLGTEALRPKAHGFRRGKIDKQALRRHVEDHPDMFLHERAKVFGVDASSICRMLKKLGIVKKRAGL